MFDDGRRIAAPPACGRRAAWRCTAAWVGWVVAAIVLAIAFGHGAG